MVLLLLRGGRGDGGDGGGGGEGKKSSACLTYEMTVKVIMLGYLCIVFVWCLCRLSVVWL